MGRLRAVWSLGVLLVALLACMEPQVPGGGEAILPESQDSIPPQKVLHRTFELNVPADVNFQWEIEPGKSLDVYVLTPEQEQRIQSGQTPSEPGRDYIRLDRGVTAAGNNVQALQPGRYDWAFQNATDSAVSVKSSASGIRH